MATLMCLPECRKNIEQESKTVLLKMCFLPIKKCARTVKTFLFYFNEEFFKKIVQTLKVQCIYFVH